MIKCIQALIAYALLAFATVPALAQSADGSFSAPPDGFDTRREGIDRGKLETVEYDSRTVGIERKARVYTPPGYSRASAHSGVAWQDEWSCARRCDFVEPTSVW